MRINSPWIKHLPAYAILLIFLSGFSAKSPAADSSMPLQIGIYEKPPYAIKNKDGKWEGISVTLWNGITLETGLKYEFLETPFSDIIPSIVSGKLDAAIGEIEINEEAEKKIDFTQSYMISGIGLAVAPASWRATMKNIFNDFFNWTLGKVALATLAALIATSILIWLVEKKHASGHFQEGVRGLGSALWFGAVTMSTVGYGDKTPSTLPGRLIAIFWMIFGVILVSVFTATLTSSMSATLANLDINSISDFSRLTCGALRGSESSELLHKIGINVHDYDTTENALVELAKKNIDAVVGDKNTLLYFQKKFALQKPPVHFHIPRFTLSESVLAIPIRDDHPDIEKINQALLKITGSKDWQYVLSMWLGTSSGNIAL